MLKAIIFDLDGVIVDTAKYHYLAWRKLAEKLGFDFTEEHNEPLKGISRMDSLEHLLRIGHVRATAAEKIHYCDLKNTWYLEYTNDMNSDEILPGALDLILEAKKHDVKIALGSASKNARPILAKTEIESLFDCIVDGNDVIKSKPDPEVFLKAAANLSMEARHCVVIEDSAKGIEAALAGGFIAVGIGDPTHLGAAHQVFKNMSQLNVSILQQLFN